MKPTTIRGVPLHVSPAFLCLVLVFGFLAGRDLAHTSLVRIPEFATLEEALRAFEPGSAPATQVQPSLGWAIAAGLGVAFVYALSVVAHELGHVAAARGAGAGVSAMQLHAAGGFVEIDDDDHLTAGRLATIAGAGPLVTAAIALVSWLALTALGWPLTGVPVEGSGAEAAAGRVLSAALVINVFALAVNLLPFRALDGGQLLAAARLRHSRSGG